MVKILPAGYFKVFK